jgi:hypothetical protein
MLPFYADERATMHHGDCLDVLRTLPDASVDSVVTDPPYELGFMGKGWDASGIAYRVDLWEECLRVLKPGGHLLAFGGTRTWHRLTCAIEDAGFEIRDTITWLYGSGFPKSLDVSKAIDKARRRDYVEAAIRLGVPLPGRSVDDWTKENHAPGDRWWAAFRAALPEATWREIEREVIGHGASGRAEVAYARPRAGSYDVTAPATDDAARWQGWGTALKPASEPIVVARKPLAATVAATVLAHGTGALNIDACRVEGGPIMGAGGTRRSGGIMGASEPLGGWEPAHSGRWPANVVLTHGDCGDECVPGCPVAELDAQSGNRPGATSNSASEGGAGFMRDGGFMRGAAGLPLRLGYADEGGASRYFPAFRYQAKAPTRERPKVDGVAHPTVKPLALMAWLIRLVTPPGGVVLDPFAGSGTTVEAALTEGVRCITIEREAEYLPLILARIERQAAPAPSDGPGQMSLLDEPAA